MKTTFLILLVFATTLSCGDDDSNTTQEPLNLNEVSGVWNLTKFEPGFAETQNYDVGDIIWSVTAEDAINVELNVTAHPQLPLNVNGSYPYTLNETENTITIEGVEYDYEIFESTLKLYDDPEADGYILTFEELEN